MISTLLYPFKLVCDPTYLHPYPKVVAWFQSCVQQPEFQQIVGTVTMCTKEMYAPGQEAMMKQGKVDTNVVGFNHQPTTSLPKSMVGTETATKSTTLMSSKQEEVEYRVVVVAITPKPTIDPQALYTKIKSEIVSQPQYRLRWDDNCKIDANGKIQATFVITLDADFDEEVMDVLEMMEEVQYSNITFQSAMEDGGEGIGMETTSAPDTMATTISADTTTMENTTSTKDEITTTTTIPEERRVVVIGIQPCPGIDPHTLYEKIKAQIVSQPEYNLKWDDHCKLIGTTNKIQATFTIALQADFDEEVMDVLEMMEDDIQSSEITFQSAME